MRFSDALRGKHRPNENPLVGQVKSLIRPYLRHLPGRGPQPLSWASAFAVLDRYGLSPRTIFDIGVAFGTYDLYRAYPDAFYHLIDPTPESLFYMRRLQRELRCELHCLALGDHDGEATIEIRHDVQGATMLEDLGPRQVVRHDRVALRRFDSLIGTFDRPALCKIDVQGAELMVLEGMTGRLREIDALIIETSTICSMKGGVEVYDIVHFLRGHGFVVADVLGLARRPLDNAVAQLDLMFLPHASAVRADRRWGSTA